MSHPVLTLPHFVTARERHLAHAIVATTDRLVDHALVQDWDKIPGTLLERRALLQDLEQGARGCRRSASCLAAIRSALLESERAVAVLRLRATTH
jgi:hypothetical protein